FTRYVGQSTLDRGAGKSVSNASMWPRVDRTTVLNAIEPYDSDPAAYLPSGARAQGRLSRRVNSRPSYFRLTATVSAAPIAPPASCAPMKGSADSGEIPANVSVKIRPTVTAGFANAVDDVNQYAAPMYAPTAAPMKLVRPLRARTKITSTSPVVATTSERRLPGVTRPVAENEEGRSNIAFAKSAPATPPASCAATYAATCPRERSAPPSSAATRVTTGLKWAPLTPMNTTMSTASPSVVARLFCRSCSPVSSGES